jgi:oligopeptide/dipeptide ABC transporter ATP-binding protein
LNLLQDLKDELGFTYLFISHNLSVVKHISDRIAVMYLGKIIELASRQDLFDAPLHPYTQALLSAIPIPRFGVERKRIILEGDVPSPVNPSPGCRFYGRCPSRRDGCLETMPALMDVGKHRRGHFVACFHPGPSGPIAR